MLRAVTAILVAVRATTAIAADGPPPPEPVDATARYEVRWTGLTVGEILVNVKTDASGRALRLDSRTAGALDWFFTYRSTITSTTGLEAGRPVTTRFAASRAFNDQEQDWSLTFDAAGRILQGEISAEIAAEHEPVPPELQHGPDPLAFAIDALARLGPGVNLQGDTFDGKRVLHLDIDCGVDREPVSPIPETPQQPALACRIGGELLAGARKDDDDDDEEDERTGRERTVTARLVDNLIPGYAIPAIIQAETRWGTVVTRLVEMTVR
ncbi:MAG: DUF3108 domain-containing protein [Geminicoccaceae bacterium]